MRNEVDEVGGRVAGRMRAGGERPREPNEGIGVNTKAVGVLELERDLMKVVFGKINPGNLHKTGLKEERLESGKPARKLLQQSQR